MRWSNGFSSFIGIPIKSDFWLCLLFTTRTYQSPPQPRASSTIRRSAETFRVADTRRSFRQCRMHDVEPPHWQRDRRATFDPNLPTRAVSAVHQLTNFSCNWSRPFYCFPLLFLTLEFQSRSTKTLDSFCNLLTMHIIFYGLSSSHFCQHLTPITRISFQRENLHINERSRHFISSR